jgi:hypothetical protein
MDPNPDYDASDELEYGFNWFAWILRGVYRPQLTRRYNSRPVCALAHPIARELQSETRD